ncbi:MAG: M23 family metallopeptidase [candidate division WOR-3 bacterium]
MKTFLTKAIILATLLTIHTNIFAYVWPVEDIQPRVASTYGDLRVTAYEGRFHSGLDIQSEIGVNAYALTNGTVFVIVSPGWGKAFYLRESAYNRKWLYLHLGTLNVVTGQIVTENEIVGDIIAPPPQGYEGNFASHLHLTFNDPEKIEVAPIDNPLLYLPYSDPGDAVPFVWFPEIFIYERVAIKNINNKLWWLYPTYAGQPTPVIYDYVDILAKAQDNMNGTLANGNRVYTGVFEPGFWITDMADNSVLGPLFLHEFSVSLPDAAQLYNYYSADNPSSQTHDFYYIVTNIEGDATKCWATKARSGGTSENDPKARINSEAVFPDKGYKVWLINRDVAGHIGQDVAYVCLDNFRPYVKGVQIGQEEKVVKYQAHWPTEPVSDYDLGALIVDKDDYCKVGKLLTFLIEFSEEMKADVLPTLQVQFPNGTIKTVPNGQWVGNNVYQAVTGNDFIPSGTSGRATLQISGAQDLAGNQNDGNPRTIAYRDAGGE